MKKNTLLLWLLNIFILCFYTASSFACPICHTPLGQAVRIGIVNNAFLQTLGTTFLVFISFGLIAMITSHFLASRTKYISTFPNQSDSYHILKYLLLSGFLLGGSIAGFTDGIVFHQLLQAHNMIANWLPTNSLVNMEINMFWDGLFHLLTFGMAIISIIVLWKLLNKTNHKIPTQYFLASIILGAGIFNVVEGIIDHHALQLHHVLQNSAPNIQHLSDLIFTVISISLVVIGVYKLKINRSTN